MKKSNNKLAFATLLLSSATLALSSCGRKSYEEQMVEEAEEFTAKQCPKAIDACTTIDSMRFDPQTRTSQYYYTLSGGLDDPKALNECVIEDFRESMLVKLREDLSLKKEKENKIGFLYTYFSKKTGKKLLQLYFSEKDYTGKMSVHSFNYREARNMKQFCKTQCPMSQGDGTILDSLWYDSITRTLHYDYSLTGQLDDDSLLEHNPDIPKLLKKQLLKSIKEDPSLVEARDKEHINYQFRYYSKSSGAKIIDMPVKGTEIK